MYKIYILGFGNIGRFCAFKIINSSSKSFSLAGIKTRNRLVHCPVNWKTLTFHDFVSKVQEEEKKSINEEIEQIELDQPNVIIIDCTASDSLTQNYKEWLQRGFFLICANKKVLCNSQNDYNDFIALSNNGQRLLYEATVGAGIPIIRTLKSIEFYGDKICKVQGIMSGTISYLFNEFCSNLEKSFSSIVMHCIDLGYSEPDPRDDLNGLDFARKLLILSRLLGLELELEDIQIDNILPAELMTLSKESFLDELPNFDNHFNQMRTAALESGCVIRFIGEIDLLKSSVTLSIKNVNSSHAFYNLKGNDNIFAIISKSFPDAIVLQGPGAGQASTVLGLMSDLSQI